MRSLSMAFALVVAVLPLQPLGAEEAHTTRIETRPIYGASVTIEHGVRVYRPLPPTTHLIINPGGRTPLVLGVGSQDIINQNAVTVGR